MDQPFERRSSSATPDLGAASEESPHLAVPGDRNVVAELACAPGANGAQAEVSQRV